MRVAMVVESMFGHTQELAESVAHGMRDHGVDVVVVPADEALAGLPGAALAGVDLLVLGAPTHALSLSRPGTRADAVRQGADAEHTGSGVREWLTALETHVGERPPVAVFDTRVKVTKHLPGSAAHAMTKRLGHQGFVVLEHTTFWVSGTQGPILEGEVSRARDWGHSLVPAVRALGVARP